MQTTPLARTAAFQFLNYGGECGPKFAILPSPDSFPNLSTVVLEPLEMNRCDVDIVFLCPTLLIQAPHDRRKTRTILVKLFCPRRRRSIEYSSPTALALRMASRAKV